jgi:hypothetical protein
MQTRESLTGERRFIATLAEWAIDQQSDPPAQLLAEILEDERWLAALSEADQRIMKGALWQAFRFGYEIGREVGRMGGGAEET